MISYYNRYNLLYNTTHNLYSVSILLFIFTLNDIFLPYNKCISEGMMVGVSCVTTSYFILLGSIFADLFNLNQKENLFH